MNDLMINPCNVSCNSPADILNRGCFCTTLNREKLHNILRSDALNQDVLATHPQLFSNTSVFISPAHLQQMQFTIAAVKRVASLPGYAQQVLHRAPSIAAYNFGTEGVFMGYDFHLNAQGPKVIEINTNAGGAFLNSALVSAQTECCRATGVILPLLKDRIEEQFMAMFFQEWKLQRGDKSLKVIAIVDEIPQQQFLYPEFNMAQRLFEQQGLMAIIADPQELTFVEGRLHYQNHVVDLVYNRLTDFSLAQLENTSLRLAYEADAVVVTPNPRHHAFYADKRNLVTLSDSNILKSIGANENDMAILQAGIPITQNVTTENAVDLWQARKQLFFKPASGFGGRATYRGDKLTKRVWGEILQGEYVAQQLVIPSERGILVDGHEAALKMDIRAYVYRDEIQLLAARLYQGQTTNFKTQGGGFAPVFIAT